MDNVPSGPFRRLHHICIVVHDADAAMVYYEKAGIGPWQAYPPLTEYDPLNVPDRDAFLAMRYLFCDLDNVQLQLCQPPHANCPQREFLDTHGEGVFHIGFEVPDLDQAEQDAARRGIEILMSGRRADQSGFAYFDTADDAGVVLEVRKSKDQAIS